MEGSWTVYLSMSLGPVLFGYLLNVLVGTSSLVQNNWSHIGLGASLMTIFGLWFLARAFGRHLGGTERGLHLTLAPPALAILLYLWQFAWVAREGQIRFLAILPQLYYASLIWPVSRFLGDMGTGSGLSVGVLSIILMGAVVFSGYRRGGEEARGEWEGPTF